MIVLVGWNENGDWIAKNEWGTSWGVEGYATIDQNQACGLLNVQIYQNWNFVSRYFIELTTSDGWNGNVISIQQGIQEPIYFG